MSMTERHTMWLRSFRGQRDEYIVLSAHYDSTTLSHGAYDNMSGCAGLLGIMEALRRTRS